MKPIYVTDFSVNDDEFYFSIATTPNNKEQLEQLLKLNRESRSKLDEIFVMYVSGLLRPLMKVIVDKCYIRMTNETTLDIEENTLIYNFRCYMIKGLSIYRWNGDLEEPEA